MSRNTFWIRLLLAAVFLWLLRTVLGWPEVRQLYPVPLDKWVHVGVFFCLPFLLRWVAACPLWLLFTAPLTLGAAEELLQKYEPGRACDLNDWLAELVGVSLACAVLWWWRR